MTGRPRWTPSPIATDDVDLPPELEALTEALAEHAHDTWAQLRIDEGWTIGPERDDRLKTTPNLVPYGELPDAERNYDRELALQTLKLIVKLGFRIEPAPPG